MRYAIVSDIHANYTAWKAVLTDISAMKADKIICLGDIVGYGPEPGKVLESVYQHVDALVMGNHDAVVAGKMSSDCFNDNAARMIKWTEKGISAQGRSFLSKLPLVLNAPSFVCTHGSLDAPAAFNYISTLEEASTTFEKSTAQLIFVGHTHVAEIIVLGASGVPHQLAPQDFVLEEGKRYIINPGSVGIPRDKDPRASYCIFDDKTKVITFHRVAIDCDSVRKAFTDAGLSEKDAAAYMQDPVAGLTPVREALNFTPAKDQRSFAHNVIESADINKLKKSNKKLKTIITLVSLSAALLAGALTYTATKKETPAALTMPEKPLMHMTAVRRVADGQNVLPPIPPPTGDKSATPLIQDWRYRLENREEQSISLGIDKESGENIIIIKNAARHQIHLEAPTWVHDGHADGMRIKISVKSKTKDDFSGTASFSATANYGATNEIRLVEADLNTSEKGEFASTQRTTEKSRSNRYLSAENKDVTYIISGTFKGTLIISTPVMTVVQ